MSGSASSLFLGVNDTNDVGCVEDAVRNSKAVCNNAILAWFFFSVDA